MSLHSTLMNPTVKYGNDVMDMAVEYDDTDQTQDDGKTVYLVLSSSCVSHKNYFIFCSSY